MASITKRGKTYRIKAFVGYDTNGKQQVRTMTYTPAEGMSERQAEKEAQRQAFIFEERIKNGLLADGKTKFSDFADYWLRIYAEPKLKAKTIIRYKGLLKRINLAIGHIPLNKIMPAHLMEFYNALKSETPENAVYRCKVDFKKYLKEKKMSQVALSCKTSLSLSTISNIIKGKNVSAETANVVSAALNVPLQVLFVLQNPQKRLSSYTIVHYHRLISDILGIAVKWQYIPYNPCSRVDPPKGKTEEIVYLDEYQSKHLMELLQKEKSIYRRAISLLLLTGMRRGELLGLEWKDVDFDAKTIYVHQTSQYLPSQGIYDETPKTKSSKRLIMISPQVISVLREQLEWQQRQFHTAPDRWHNSGRIITDEHGAPMHPDRLTRWFRKFVKKTDLPTDLHLHSLRHTYATLCIANGVPITAVSSQLGHANVAITAKIYAHAIKSAEIAAADKIGGLFSDVIKT